MPRLRLVTVTVGAVHEPTVREQALVAPPLLPPLEPAAPPVLAPPVLAPPVLAPPVLVCPPAELPAPPPRPAVLV
jgi:hypothetical protein